MNTQSKPVGVTIRLPRLLIYALKSGDAVAVSHHDPQHDDGEVARMTQETSTRLEAAGVKETVVFAAREGLKLRVQKSAPPLSLVW